MDPRKKADRQPQDRQEEDTTRREGPALEETDWEALEGGAMTPDSIPENGDLRYDVERDGEPPEEDDDNPYQNSDEALPDDREEAALTRDPSKEHGRFDEV